jgi:hypothetical protein
MFGIPGAAFSSFCMNRSVLYPDFISSRMASSSSNLVRMVLGYVALAIMAIVVRDGSRRDSASAAERIYVLTSTSILHPCLPTARYLQCLPTFTVYLFAVHNTTLRLM